MSSKYTLPALLFLLTTSCAHQVVQTSRVQPNREDLDLYQHLNAEEREINECLKDVMTFASANESSAREAQNFCLANTPFDKRDLRHPSASTSELLEANQWLFSSPTKINTLYNVITGIQKAYRSLKNKVGDHISEAIEEKGVGFSGEATIGIGANWLGELDVHDHKLGLFCAPGIVAKTDAGIGASIEIGKSLNCHSNQEYAGGFLSFEAGLSGELLALPFEVGVAYNFGINGPAFYKDLKRAYESGEIDARALQSELNTLNSIRPVIIKKMLGNRISSLVGLDYVLKVLSFFNKDLRMPETSYSNPMQAAETLSHTSVGKTIKDMVRSKKFSRFLLGYNLKNTNAIVTLLSNSLSGCDSVGGSASLSLSLSPVSVGVMYSNFELLLEVPLSSFDVLNVINPLVLMNPRLMNYREMSAITSFARDLLALKNNLDTKCSFREALRF